MSEFLRTLWQFNLELSLLLLVTLGARYAVRKTTKNYNAYLLWLSIPLGLLTAVVVANIGLSEPPVKAVGYIVQSYVIEPSRSIDGMSALGYLWIFIAAMLLLRLIAQHHSLRSDLVQISVDENLHLRSEYPVVGIDQADFSPAVYGFIKPTIYFPVHLLKELNRDQIALIIEHEQHHIKQQHLWLNLLWDILVCVMWFNPFVYLSRQSFRHDQELFCDYLVLNKSTQQAQKSYGHALLSTVSATHSVSLLCSWKSFNQLEERIMNIKTPSSVTSKVLIALCGAAIVASASLYTASAADYAEKKVIKIVHDVDLDHEHGDEMRRVRIKKDDKTFVEENGERYILEYDQQRPMTDEEAEEFERELQMAHTFVIPVPPAPPAPPAPGVAPVPPVPPVAPLPPSLKGGNYEIRVIRSADGETMELTEGMLNGLPHGLISTGMIGLDGSEIQIEEFAEILEMSEEQQQAFAEQMRQVEIQIEQHHGEFARAEREVAMAMREIEAARAADEITAAAMEQARAQLEATRATLGYEEENMRRSLENARAEIARLREEVNKSKRPN